MFKIFLISFIFLFFGIIVKSQIPPIADPAWIIQTSTSEEFDSPLNFATKWFNQYPWGPINNGAEYNYTTNLIETGTSLKIKADTLILSILPHFPSYYSNPYSAGVTFNHQGGVLQSRNYDYHFGYIEIEAKFPESGCWPLWPAFWLWSQDCATPFYDEIDIAEMGANDAFEGHTMGTNIWLYDYGNCTPPGTTQRQNPLSISGLPLLNDAVHKYAVEWCPDRVIWYFDDTPVRTVYDPTGIDIPQHAMEVILNFAISPWDAWLLSDWNNLSLNPKLPTCFAVPPNTPTPKYFEINYLRYYKLNIDNNCNTDLFICNPSTDYSSRAVEKSITTGGSCSLTFNTSDSYTLRASTYILLDEGTTINSNSSGFFAIIPMPCPQ